MMTVRLDALKTSNLAGEWLRDLYRKFDAEDRDMANQVLAEWALSDDENVRHDALILIDDFSVISALPALQDLAARLRLSKAPSAPHELQKVDSILWKLGGRPHTSHG